MKKSLYLLTAIFCIANINISAQDSLYARRIVSDLTQDAFHGRGYYKGGDNKAAEYLAGEFKKLGLQSVQGSYFQDFSFPVNTFPGKVEITIGGKKLVPGKDFLIDPACPPVSGKFGIVRAEWPFSAYYKKDLTKDFILIDKSRADSSGKVQLDEMQNNPPKRMGGMFNVEPTKLTWSVARSVNDKPYFSVLLDSFPAEAKELEINVSSKFVEDYKTRNVIAMIPGTTNPDSFIVFTAHYDHLGRMGSDAIFPGANDNASGVSMLLNLAKYYADTTHRNGKTIVFILFAAEEAGLVGSNYFVNNPLIPLEKIRFLINMDLMGTGEDGIMVVNGTLHEMEFNLLQEINERGKLLKEVGKRGTARNSDHYYFSEKGVPAFFFYTTGGPKAYHDIYDKASNLTFTGYKGVFQLIANFVSVVGK